MVLTLDVKFALCLRHSTPQDPFLCNMPAGRLEEKFSSPHAASSGGELRGWLGSCFAAADRSRPQPDTPFEHAPLPASPVVYGILVNGFAIEGICEVSGKGGVDGFPN